MISYKTLRLPLGVFNAHMGNDSITWRGMTGLNSLADLSPNGVQLLDLTITNTMFRHKDVHLAPVGSADLLPYVLVTWVERGVDLSTNQELTRGMPDRPTRLKHVLSINESR